MSEPTKATSRRHLVRTHLAGVVALALVGATVGEAIPHLPRGTSLRVRARLARAFGVQRAYYLDLYRIGDLVGTPGGELRCAFGRGTVTWGGESGTLDFDELASILRRATGGDDVWRDPAYFELYRSRLIVNQTDDVHAAIRDVLGELRRERLPRPVELR